MATDYGVDVAALDDLPDPEVLTTETENVAYGVGRSWLTPQDGLSDVGYEGPYTSLDLRDYLGARLPPGQVAVLQRQLEAIALQHPDVASITVTVAFAGGSISVTARGTGADGPFAFVVNVDAVTSTLLLEGPT